MVQKCLSQKSCRFIIQKTFHQLTSSACKILKGYTKGDFTKYALLTIIQYVQWSSIGEVKNPVYLSKIIFFIIKLPHANLQ